MPAGGGGRRSLYTLAVDVDAGAPLPLPPPLARGRGGSGAVTVRVGFVRRGGVLARRQTRRRGKVSPLRRVAGRGNRGTGDIDGCCGSRRRGDGRRTSGDGVLVDDGVAGDPAPEGGAPANLAGLAVDTVLADEGVDVGGAHRCGVVAVISYKDLCVVGVVGGDDVVNPGVCGDDDLGRGSGSLSTAVGARGEV